MYTGSLSTISNKEDWVIDGYISDFQTGEALDISSATELEVALSERGNGTPLIAKDLNDGVSVLGSDQPGYWQMIVPASEMSTVDPGTYAVGISIEMGGTRAQLFAGIMSVIDGVVQL